MSLFISLEKSLSPIPIMCSRYVTLLGVGEFQKLLSGILAHEMCFGLSGLFISSSTLVPSGLGQHWSETKSLIRACFSFSRAEKCFHSCSGEPPSGSFLSGLWLCSKVAMASSALNISVSGFMPFHSLSLAIPSTPPLDIYTSLLLYLVLEPVQLELTVANQDNQIWAEMHEP